MRRPYLEHYISPVSLPEIRVVKLERPWFWLSAGWSDFVAAPGVSLFYGFLVVLAFELVTFFLGSIGSYHWAIALMPGFLFLGPVLAVGLYEISRRREGELEVSLVDTVRGWRRNTMATFSLGIIMVLLMLVWFMLSFELTAVFVANASVMSSVFGGATDLPGFLTSVTLPMVAAVSISGVIALAIAFLFTVVSVPLVVDHEDMDVITAVVTSVQVCVRNWRPMLLWAALVVVFAGIGILPLYLGLIVTFPLLGYATWHAYRDIIGG